MEFPLSVIRLIPVLLLSLTAAAQGSPPFPQARLEQLREEVVYEAPEPVDEPELPEWDFDWEAYRRPLTIALAVVVVLALGTLIFLILGGLDLVRKPPEKPGQGAIMVSEIREDEMVEHGVDARLLQRAEAAGQYAIAVRLHYIGLLKELKDAGVIRYRQDYSNRDYARQLAGSPFREDFQAVTAAYERYWYGQYRIDRLSYRLVSRDFEALGERISAVLDQTRGV